MTRTDKITLFIAINLFISITSFAQIIDLAKKSIEEVVTYESLENSVCTDTIASYGILKKPFYDHETLIQTRVLIFKRNHDEFDPKLHVWYHFERDSNNTKAIRYNWGLYNPGFNPVKEEGKLRDFMKREKDFVKKFNLLKSELQNKLGSPSITKTIADNDTKLNKHVFWEDDEKTVWLAIKFSRQFIEIPKLGKIADYEISVMITYK